MIQHAFLELIITFTYGTLIPPIVIVPIIKLSPHDGQVKECAIWRGDNYTIVFQ